MRLEIVKEPFLERYVSIEDLKNWEGHLASHKNLSRLYHRSEAVIERSFLIVLLSEARLI